MKDIKREGYFCLFLNQTKICRRIPTHCNQLQNVGHRLQKIIERVLKCKYAKSEGLYCN